MVNEEKEADFFVSYLFSILNIEWKFFAVQSCINV